MRFIPTRIHGIIDYLVGALLIGLPWLFDFADGGAEQWVPVILGVATIVYSLLTDYAHSLAKVIPMPTHLAIDLAAGIVLAISPWLFGFSDEVYWPHLILGIFEIIAALTTQTRPTYYFDRDDFSSGSRSQI